MSEPSAQNLKLATVKDMPVLLEMASRFIKASPYAQFPVDNDKVEKLIFNLLEDKNSTVILYMHKDKPVGMIAGTVNEFLFNFQKVASEVVWWVDPGFRSRKSLALQDAFEYWAKHKMEATMVHMGSLADPSVGRWYERRGYKLTENSFVKEL